uniref:Uncharacterized protein n=1 Tax=Nyssomyia neivai TaxID=330878 RepID=A0A1L8D762_9DIPT
MPQRMFKMGFFCGLLSHPGIECYEMCVCTKSGDQGGVCTFVLFFFSLVVVTRNIYFTYIYIIYYIYPRDVYNGASLTLKFPREFNPHHIQNFCKVNFRIYLK